MVEHVAVVDAQKLGQECAAEDVFCKGAALQCVTRGFCVSMQSIQNLGLAIIAIAAGMILDTRGYLFLEVFFSACVCCKC